MIVALQSHGSGGPDPRTIGTILALQSDGSVGPGPRTIGTIVALHHRGRTSKNVVGKYMYPYDIYSRGHNCE